MHSKLKLADEFLRNHLSKGSVSPEEIRYRYEHSLRVTNIGLKLARAEGANLEVTALACLLHDVGKFDVEDNIEHGRISAKIARPFLLNKLGLEKKTVDDICYAIASHVDGESGYPYESIIEAKVVTDADNIDRYGAYRIFQHMNWLGISTGEIAERIERTSTYLEKLKKYRDRCAAAGESKSRLLETDSGNQWFKEQLDLQIEYFTRHLEELRITRLPDLAPNTHSD